jgi:N-hydroxyarylamine O-acetyltransferase
MGSASDMAPCRRRGAGCRLSRRVLEAAMPDFDLDAYLARIGYDGPRAPTLETLKALHALHPAAIPFENLEPLLGRPVTLDLPSLTRKLISGERGGYCYEHNTVFQAALLALGFSVGGLAARVEWGAPPDRINPRSHMLLRVALPEGDHIADVGFGGLTLTGPLLLTPDVEQSTPQGLFRLISVGDALQLQVKLGDGWPAMYRFDLSPAPPIDYEVANWFVSTHPSSIFTFNLLAARALPDRRLALMNGDLSIYHLDGGVERRRLTDASELAALLSVDFGIRLPEGAEAALARVMARPDQE